MPIFYDFIFLIIAIAYLPIYLFRRKFHPEFWQRLGFLPQGLKPGRPIWIHAVSVGEVVAARMEESYDKADMLLYWGDYRVIGEKVD